jgi:hypothetical protein
MNEFDQVQFPNDADGDVLRRMASKGFDFSKRYVIDFTVDFEDWPPSIDAIRALEIEFGELVVHDDDDGDGGYVLFKCKGELSYELVLSIQAKATKLMQPYGGWCDSWGVLHSGPQ